MSKTIDLSQFQRSSDFYPSIGILVTVKSFDLQAIRKRYLQSRMSGSGKAGSVERRNPGKGGILQLRLEQGAIKEERILCQLTEPRGIDFRDDKLAIAAENTIYHFDEKGQMTILEDKWFSYIHTVKFHPEEPDRVLISSSGLDLIKEYSIAKQRETYEWLAWEHGFARSHDPASGRELWLTRSPEQAAKWKHQGRAICPPRCGRHSSIRSITAVEGS